MRDLFGQVVVTYEDLHVWVSAIAPHFASTERSYAYYVENWNVAGKVSAAKLAGTFDSTIENARARRAFLARRYGAIPAP